ncbi:MAG: hypothetical protein ACP5MH_08895 [Thermoproteus sp.]
MIRAACGWLRLDAAGVAEDRAPRLWLYVTAAGAATLWMPAGGALLAAAGFLSSPSGSAAGGQA